MTEIAPRPSFKAKVTDIPQIDKIIFYHQWKHKISKQKKWNSMREKQDHIDVQLNLLLTHTPHMKHTRFCANTHFVHMCTTPPPPRGPQPCSGPVTESISCPLGDPRPVPLAPREAVWTPDTQPNREKYQLKRKVGRKNQSGVPSVEFSATMSFTLASVKRK